MHGGVFATYSRSKPPSLNLVQRVIFDVEQSRAARPWTQAPGSQLGSGPEASVRGRTASFAVASSTQLLPKAI